MIFSRNDRARLTRAALNELGIDRFDGKHVNDADGDALLCKRLRRLQGLRDHDATGDNRHVLAVGKDVALANFKR